MFECPRCGSLNTIKWGFRRWTRKDGMTSKTQRFKCKRCGLYFNKATSKKGALVILAPRPMLANLFFELKTFLQNSPAVKMRAGAITIRELS